MNMYTNRMCTSSYRLFALSMIIVILAAFLPVALPVIASPPLLADQGLLAAATTTPDAQLEVIVQKRSSDNALDALVSQLGGTITQDLRIINGFAASIPARALPVLARAEGVRWISPNSAVTETRKGPSPIDTSRLRPTFIGTINAARVWNTAPYRRGTGVGVAVVDSGVDRTHPDFENGTRESRVVVSAKFNSATNNASDGFGHGTHVAGLIGGYGRSAGNQFMGVAPEAHIINVKVSDDQGAASAADVVNGLQWVLENKETHNIRVVNLSLNSSIYEPYHVSPLCAAVEILWFNGIVVVVSAGNTGSGTLYPPANDPFVITVGATNERNTADRGDDHLAPFSAGGITPEGYSKPELLAPGTKLYSTISGGSRLAKSFPTSVMTTPSGATYFKLSGTSMAAPLVSGAVALLLQDEPSLTPDQVKHRLMATGSSFPDTTAKYLDVYGAVHSTTTESANTGVQASLLLTSGTAPVTWNSMAWNSVAWNSVAWNSVAWNSMAWNSMAWNSTFFGDQLLSLNGNDE